MINKAFLVNAITHKVLSHRIEGEKLTIVTDRKWLTVDLVNADKLLTTFLETEQEDPETLPATQTAQVVHVIQQPVVLQSAYDLKAIMMDNIKKIQDNKDYIPQASEINSQINTLINLAKTEIEFVKLTRR